MIDNQKGRRNVSDYDKGLLAMRKQELLRPIAVKNLSAGGKSAGKGRPQQPSAKLPKAIDTRREAAKEAGIGERTLDAVKLIKDAADKGEIAPEVIDEIRHRKIAIHRVAKDIKETRREGWQASWQTSAAPDARTKDEKGGNRVTVGNRFWRRFETI